MKPTQYFALIIGVFLVLTGVLGFIPALVQAPAASANEVNLALTSGYGDLMGIFPTNTFFNIIRLSIGLLGILATTSLGSARLYSGVVALSYGLFAILGLFPPTQSLFGLVPIFGNNIWFHAVSGTIAAYFGFFATPNLAELAEDSIGSKS